MMPSEEDGELPFGTTVTVDNGLLFGKVLFTGFALLLLIGLVL